jgi:hypothetical protein
VIYSYSGTTIGPLGGVGGDTGGVLGPPGPLVPGPFCHPVVLPPQASDFCDQDALLF